MDLPNDFEWSFSKLSAFETCPYQFFLTYIFDGDIHLQQNAFAEFGTLCHSLMEEYAKGTLCAQQLAEEYEKRFDSVVQHDFPPFPAGLAEKNYEQGLEFFSAFTGFLPQYDVVSVEEKFHITIAGHPFVGIADLVVRDRTDGKLIIFDYKTTSESSMRKSKDKYVRQLYIYAEHLYQKYGEYPKEMQLILLKSNRSIREPFSLEKHEETLRWISDTIDLITLEEDWTAKPSDYFCRFVCGLYDFCEDAQNI